MQKVIFILIFSLCSLQAFALEAALTKIQFQGKEYKLVLDQGNLTATRGDKKLTGDLTKRLGDISQWEFRLNGDTGFDIILNEKTKKIINQKNNLDAGGPFLHSLSPDSKLIVLDFGTGPDLRDFEVRNQGGKVLLRDAYFNRLTWTKDELEYAHPIKTLPNDFNAQTKKCGTGTAYLIQLYHFNGIEKRKVDTPPTIECGQ